MTETDAVRGGFAVTAERLGPPDRRARRRARASGCAASSRSPVTERALDSGTGTGALAFALAPLVREVVAVDVVPELLDEGRKRRARTRPTSSFREGDATALPFGDGEFDLAGSLRTLHHLPRPELAVAELVRVTRPGGIVLVVDQVAPIDPLAALALDRFERARDPSHTRVLPDTDLRGLFDANDLVLRRAEFETRAARGRAVPRPRRLRWRRARAGPRAGRRRSYAATIGWYLSSSPSPLDRAPDRRSVARLRVASVEDGVDRVPQVLLGHGVLVARVVDRAVVDESAVGGRTGTPRASAPARRRARRLILVVEVVEGEAPLRACCFIASNESAGYRSASLELIATSRKPRSRVVALDRAHPPLPRQDVRAVVARPDDGASAARRRSRRANGRRRRRRGGRTAGPRLRARASSECGLQVVAAGDRGDPPVGQVVDAAGERRLRGRAAAVDVAAVDPDRRRAPESGAPRPPRRSSPRACGSRRRHRARRARRRAARAPPGRTGSRPSTEARRPRVEPTTRLPPASPRQDARERPGATAWITAAAGTSAGRRSRRSRARRRRRPARRRARARRRCAAAPDAP